MSDITEEMAMIQDYLLGAAEYGLQTEVVTWALIAMRDTPSLSLSDAMAQGYYEWVK